MKVSDCEMSLDFQIRGKGYCSTLQCRHTALRWRGPAPRCEVLHNAPVLQTSWSLFNRTRQAFHPGAHTFGPPALASSCSVPGYRWGRPVTLAWIPAPSCSQPQSRSWGGHTTSQEQMPHGRFPLTQSVPLPEEDQGEGSETPSACSGPQILRAVRVLRGAHWQHSATCLKSSSPCSSPKHRRQ